MRYTSGPGFDSRYVEISRINIQFCNYKRLNIIIQFKVEVSRVTKKNQLWAIFPRVS